MQIVRTQCLPTSAVYLLLQHIQGLRKLLTFHSAQMPHHVVIVSSTSEALTLGYAAHTTCVMDIRGAKVAAPGQHMLRQLEGESQRWQEQLVMHQLETSESNKVPDVLASMPPLI
ncbi:uncharacterized protein LOC144821874 isoform X1 [Lissotriton helveticus]